MLRDGETWLVYAGALFRAVQAVVLLVLFREPGSHSGTCAAAAAFGSSSSS